MARPWLSRNLIALSVVSFLTDVSSEMIYPLLPAFLATVLGASAMSVGLIEGAAQAVTAIVAAWSGTWSDRLGRRKPLVLAGYTIASVLRPLIGVAGSVTQVLALRVGDRVGKGIRGAPRDALIADSVAPGDRGVAFGFHRAADHAGAVIGPLLAIVLLQAVGVSLRTVFLLAAIPALLAVVVLLLAVRESTSAVVPSHPGASREPMGRSFVAYLGIVGCFTLGNSTDAFLLLRASEAGVGTAWLPLLWAVLHVVKTSVSTPGGALSDRVGRKRLIVAGWVVYAAVYLGFGYASTPWQVWALMMAYGVYYGLTEGVEKALVADLVPAGSRGRAFGLYNLVLGLVALPASVLLGALWDWRGPVVAFGFGSVMALLAALLLALVLPSGTLPNGSSHRVAETGPKS